MALTDALGVGITFLVLSGLAAVGAATTWYHAEKNPGGSLLALISVVCLILGPLFLTGVLG